MTCCQSTSTGVGSPTISPSSNDPDIYIEQPSGQIWVWNGTQWIKPPIGAVSYNSTTRVLTVGSSSVTLPIASKTEYGVVKLADPATDPNNPIEANPDGTLTINCTKLIAHCGLATKAYVDNAIGSAIGGLSGSAIVNLLTAMSQTELAGLACKLRSNEQGNLLSCRPDGLYYGTTAEADVANMYVKNSGSPTGAGTELDPVDSMATALARGQQGTYRNIHLYEGEPHYVDPANIAAYRGGTWVVSIYGPNYDALPPVAGAHKATQAAAKALGTKIVSRPAIVDSNGFQSNAALIPTASANVRYIGLTLVAAGDNGSSAARSRNKGTFNYYAAAGSVFLANTDTVLPPTAYAFDSFAIAPFTLQVENTGTCILSGAGKLFTPDTSRNFTFDVGGVQTPYIPYLPPLTTATKVVTSINTNVDANLLP